MPSQESAAFAITAGEPGEFGRVVGNAGGEYNGILEMAFSIAAVYRVGSTLHDERTQLVWDRPFEDLTSAMVDGVGHGAAKRLSTAFSLDHRPAFQKPTGSRGNRVVHHVDPSTPKVADRDSRPQGRPLRAPR